MAYVRTKKVKGRKYHQLVESRRVGGEPRQKVLVHLGQHPSVDAALEGWPKEIRSLRRRASRERKKAARLEGGSARAATERAEASEKRASELKSSLRRLRRLRKQGVV
jgi:hypothetical protein